MAKEVEDRAWDDTDDGRRWGYMLDGAFRPIPKPPLLLGHFGPPPFSVTLPSGAIRHVVHDPAEVWPPPEENTHHVRLAPPTPSPD